MSRPSVFYAWQSDLPGRTTRQLIHNATQDAICRIGGEMPLIDSPRIDHDTLGEAGAPSITDTILRKIEESAAFVADVSLVGRTTILNGRDEKRIPNPNVMLELGYAAATIGWNRVILVMNKHYGSPERLPFDLRNRRFPITYEIGPESKKMPEVTRSASIEIEYAIRSSLAAEYQRVETILSKLSSYTLGIMKSHAGQTSFWETEDDNRTLERLDLAINQLLEFGIIQCIEATSKKGFAYSWTYLGRQCCHRLGYHLPHVKHLIPDLPESSYVMVNLSNYDSLTDP